MAHWTSLAAGLHVQGLVYALDALTYQATGAGRIEGLAVSLNVRHASASTLEVGGGGELAVQFDYGHATAAGIVPPCFLPIAGTYRENSD